MLPSSIIQAMFMLSTVALTDHPSSRLCWECQIVCPVFSSFWRCTKSPSCGLAGACVRHPRLIMIFEPDKQKSKNLYLISFVRRNDFVYKGLSMDDCHQHFLYPKTPAISPVANSSSDTVLGAASRRSWSYSY
ncbi:hypothetical protein BDR03DRAFT_181013 [Suillus americanus]|nr:hypothetical protein BDR03DRAFT_181013 [Suillus americanus]